MLHSGNSQKDMVYFTVTLGYVGIDGDKKSDRLLLLVSPHFPLRLVRPSAHTGIVFDLSFSCHFGANSLNSKSLSFPLLFTPRTTKEKMALPQFSVPYQLPPFVIPFIDKSSYNFKFHF